MAGLATAAGAPEKLSTTMTIAFMSLIAERMHAATPMHSSYADFISDNGDLLNKNVLDRWYSADRLRSGLSRRAFVMPDVAPRPNAS